MAIPRAEKASTQSPEKNLSIVLDDGSFFIDLDLDHPKAQAPGFLMRRRLDAGSAGISYECVGRFAPALDDSWQATLYHPRDLRTQQCEQVVATHCSRMASIVALWRSRHGAHVPSC